MNSLSLSVGTVTVLVSAVSSYMQDYGMRSPFENRLFAMVMKGLPRYLGAGKKKKPPVEAWHVAKTVELGRMSSSQPPPGVEEPLGRQVQRMSDGSAQASAPRPWLSNAVFLACRVQSRRSGHRFPSRSRWIPRRRRDHIGGARWYVYVC
jgi:hypothetical protein